MGYNIEKLLSRRNRAPRETEEKEEKKVLSKEDIHHLATIPIEEREELVEKEDGTAELFNFNPVFDKENQRINQYVNRTEMYTNEETVEEVLRTIDIICNEIHRRDPRQLEFVKTIADMRGLNIDILLENQCFYVPNQTYLSGIFPELKLYQKDLSITTTENTLWKARFIIPIRDFYGKPYGFVGYDKFSNAKYVEWDSPVYRKATIKAIGLDTLDEILDSRYCIFTEGSFDYFRGRQNGLSIMANLGISFNRLLKLIINKLDVVFVAYDNDDTGLKNMNTIDRLHHNVYRIYFRPLEKTFINEETGEEETKEVKGDLDEALKDPIKVKKLKEEMDIRVNNPLMKLDHIYI